MVPESCEDLTNWPHSEAWFVGFTGSIDDSPLYYTFDWTPGRCYCLLSQLYGFLLGWSLRNAFL